MFGLTSVEMKLLFKAALALILFNSSVIAEIVRGGLNGVSKGQFEAGYAQGFNTAEVLLYIVLPQAYRNIVPTCSARSSPPSRTPPIWQTWPPSS